MAKVLINDTEFDLISYYLHSTGLSMRIDGEDTTISDIETAAGDLAEVRIENKLIFEDLTLRSVSEEHDYFGRSYLKTDFTTSES